MFVSQIMTAAIATTVIIRRIVNRTCGKLHGQCLDGVTVKAHLLQALQIPASYRARLSVRNYRSAVAPNRGPNGHGTLHSAYPRFPGFQPTRAAA